MKSTLSIFALTLIAFASRASAAETPPPVDSPTYERDVRPLFKTHCFHCHGEGDELEGKLDLRLRRFAIAGGKKGADIVPGHSDQSRLFQRISAGEMPPEKKPKMSAAEIALIGRWIDAGAPTVRPEPEKLDAASLITEEERNFWSFQPVKPQTPPAVKEAARIRTPIDVFIEAKLEANGLTLSPEADKAVLIRRVTFDLTGLPPAPQDIDAFLTDASPDAFEKVIDRLLASPQYGERWGRHWLDVAGYADSEGRTEHDSVRKHSWRYRDYVIKSINANKPFDQFIVEQLAGDELVNPPYNELTPDNIEKLIATGFLRMVPDGTSAVKVDQKAASNLVISDAIKVATSSLLGLTVACAQCHDHRYDPISQADYYRLRAIFEPAFNLNSWRVPAQRLISMVSAKDRKEGLKVKATISGLASARLKRTNELLAAELDKQILTVPEEKREAFRIAWKTSGAMRTGAQNSMLIKYSQANVTRLTLNKTNPTAAAEIGKMDAEIAALSATVPADDFIEALSELPGKAPVMHIFGRGDPNMPKDPVAPGELTVLTLANPVQIAEDDPALPTTGRRLAYAKWLTSGKHPLVGRVLVNRVWMHHFGKGIVGSPGDFGALGDRPTHPELLDWLANDFVTHGWDLKRLHKLILTSAAYRQTSARTDAQDLVDPDNKLVGRMSIRRLDAEQFRDALLQTSAKLNPKMFGPPVPIMPDAVGQIVVGIDNRDGVGRIVGFIPMNGEEFRRSVYIQVRRSRPLSILSAFDVPTMEPNCEARTVSTVTPQALMLMNSQFVIDQTFEFAKRVHQEAGDDAAAQVRLAWKLTMNTAPSDDDVNYLKEYLVDQKVHFQNKPAEPTKAPTTQPAPDPAIEALASLGQVLWSTNGFLYVE